MKRPVYRVALVTEDSAAETALEPARHIMGQFNVEWTDVAISPGETADLSGFAAVIVASASGVLPGKLAMATEVPVVRVPLAGGGIDVLRDAATGNLPAGEGAFATVAIGEAGAKNAALFVISSLALEDDRLRADWNAFRLRQSQAVLTGPPLRLED